MTRIQSGKNLTRIFSIYVLGSRRYALLLSLTFHYPCTGRMKGQGCYQLFKASLDTLFPRIHSPEPPDSSPRHPPLRLRRLIEHTIGCLVSSMLSINFLSHSWFVGTTGALCVYIYMSALIRRQWHIAAERLLSDK